MQEEFHLNQQLKNDSYEVLDLSLSKLLLVNNSSFPWVMLVPKKNNLKEIIDLSEEDRMILMKEISLVSQAMKKIFHPDKLNIAALGNIVEQLHIHIIARYKNDTAWPDPVFGCVKVEYSLQEYKDIINKFQEFLNVR